MQTITSFDFFAYKDTFVLNSNGHSFKLTGTAIQEFSINIDNDIQETVLLGSRNLDFIPIPRTITSELKLIHKEVETSNKEINFKEIIKKHMTIEDLFKIINKKITK